MEGTLHILLVDDNPADRVLVARSLRHEFPGSEIVQVPDEEALARALAGAAVDLVITDYQLHWSDGLAVLQAVKGCWPAVPVIMFTATGNEEVAVAAMKAGLDDYVLKSPKHYGRLPATARAVLDRARQAALRARAEAALRETTQHLRALIAASPLAIISRDLAGNVVEWNPAAEHLFGWRAEEVLGRPLPTIPADYRDEAQAQRARSLRGESLAGLESRRQRKDSSLVDVAVSTAPLYDAQGAIRGTMAIIEDISERKRLEEQVRRAERLEMAGRVAGQVAHDFNNLLSPLVGYPELIKMRLPAGHPAIAYCDEMLAAAQQLAAVTADLLTLGRRGRFEPEPADLNQLVVQTMAQMPPPEQVTTVLDLDANLLPVKVVSAQLARAIANLITNACEAIEGRGQIKITTQNVYLDGPLGHYDAVARGEYVRLDVSDNGAGIPPAVKDKIFDAYFTTKSADARRGSGLGLSIVQAVVDDHRGYVDLESAVGRGSTFSLYLPVYRPSVALPAEVHGGAESVLVVDDDAAQSELMGQMLGELGYRVSLARSGEEALGCLREQPFDLLVLDMVMAGGMDGAETYRRARALWPRQRALIVSGFALSERIVAAQKLGVGAFLAKPVLFEDLARAVRAELERG